jgi:hypothetical protein
MLPSETCCSYYACRARPTQPHRGGRCGRASSGTGQRRKAPRSSAQATTPTAALLDNKTRAAAESAPPPELAPRHATTRGCFMARPFSPIISRAQSLGVARFRLAFWAAWFSWPVRLHQQSA